MTNERAIELLHRLQDEQFDGIHGDERREALEMAVRALFSQQTVNDSQELVNDCISRQAAIDEIARWIGYLDEDMICRIQIGLKRLPSAQQQRILYANMSDAEFEKWLYEHGICNPNIHESIPCDVVPLLIDYAISELPSAQPEVLACGSGELVQESGDLVKELVKDCISRQATIDALHMHLMYRMGTDSNKKRLDDWINSLPPIQPKRGKWIKTARWGRVYYCNQCRNYLDFDGVNAGRGSANFCPNCGCRMDGEGS